MSNKEASIIWEGEKREKIPLFCSIPDTGLVGFISSIHIIQEVKMDLLGYVDAFWVPPVVSVLNGRPYPPVRIYGNDKLCILLSEVPLQSSLWGEFSNLTVKLSKEIDTNLLIGATGLPNPRRQEVTDLRIFSTFTDKGLKDTYAPDIMSFAGVMAGPYASLLQHALKNKIPSIIYLVDSYPTYPDPEAAAMIVDLVGKIIDEKIDTKTLLEKGEELRIRARQLAMETQMKHREAQAKTGRAPPSFYL